MYVIGAVVILEVALMLVAAGGIIDFVPDDRRVDALLVLLLQMLVVGSALPSVTRNSLIDDLAYIVALGVVLGHGVRHSAEYDVLYQPGIIGVAVVISAHFVMPAGVCLAPLMSLGRMGRRLRRQIDDDR